MKKVKWFYFLIGAILSLFSILKQTKFINFQNHIEKSINVEEALFAEDSKTPPVRRIIG